MVANAIAVVVLASACGRGAAPPPFPDPVAPPPAYTAVYRVEIPGAPVQFEQRWVTRPLLGRLDVTSEDGALISSLLWNDDGFFIYANGEYHEAEDGPHRPLADVRVLGVLAAAERRGLARRTGRATFAGRPCVVVRSGGARGAALGPFTDADHEETCVAADGIPGRVRSIEGGRVTRTATLVRFEAKAEAMVYSPSNVGDPLPERTSEVRAFALADLTFPIWVLPPATGYELIAAVASVSGGLGEDTLTLRLFYRDDRGELVELEEPVRGGGSPPSGVTLTTTIPGLGRADVALTLRGTELRLTGLAGQGAPAQVVMRSALGPDELQELAGAVSKQ